MIDGQNMRLGLNKDLDFSDEGRSENLRRTMEVARLLNQTGMICICAFVAPSQEWRQRARDNSLRSGRVFAVGTRQADARGTRGRRRL